MIHVMGTRRDLRSALGLRAGQCPVDESSLAAVAAVGRHQEAAR